MARFDMLTTLTLNTANFKGGIDNAKKSTQALASGVKTAGATMSSAFAPLSGILGDLGGQLGGVTSAASGGISAFKQMIPAISGIKMALISSGIGAIVVALGTAFGALMSYLKGTEEGASKLQKVMAFMKGAFNAILVRVQLLGEAVSLVFEGKFKAAGEKLKAAFQGGLLEEIKNDAKEAVSYAERENTLWRTKLDFKVEEVNLENRLKDLKNVIEDKENSTVKRQQALVEAQKIVNTLGEKRVAIATEEYSILRSQNAMGNNSREDTEKEVELEVKITSEKNRQLDAQKELLGKKNEISSLLKSDLDKLKKENELVKINVGLNVKPIDTNVLMGAPKMSVTPQALDSWTQFIDKMKEAETITGFLSMGVSGIGDAFEDMFSGAKGALKGLVTAVLQSIRTIINAYLAQAIAGMIAGESSKGLVGLITASIGVAALTGIWQSKVPAFANGGISQGGLAMVGERGAELVNLPKGSQVFSNFQTGNMFGGGGELTTRVSGSDLIFVLNNAQRRNNSYR